MWQFPWPRAPLATQPDPDPLAGLEPGPGPIRDETSAACERLFDLHNRDGHGSVYVPYGRAS